jgi:hypothetical protein
VIEAGNWMEGTSLLALVQVLSSVILDQSSRSPVVFRRKPETESPPNGIRWISIEFAGLATGLPLHVYCPAPVILSSA